MAKPKLSFSILIASVIVKICLSSTAMAQEKKLPEELKPFIPAGYEMLDFVTGHLDNDNSNDAILILKVAGEDSITDSEPNRPLLLLTRNKEGKLLIAKRNDKMVMCRQCGGVFGDPYEKTEINNQGFSISFYGGSNWRWGYDYQFTYDVKLKDWILAREKQISYLNTEPELQIKETVIEADETGIISFTDFSINREYEEKKWEVTCAKAFFHDNPKKGSKARKAYLIKNDIVTGTRTLNNFIQVEFKNSRDEFTYGFIPRTCLKALD